MPRMPKASFTATSSQPTFSSPSVGMPRFSTSGWQRSWLQRVLRARLRVKNRNLARRTRCNHDLCQPEVENLGMPTLGDENVGWLDVAVNDAFGMRGIEGVGNFDSERENQFRF